MTPPRTRVDLPVDDQHDLWREQRNADAAADAAISADRCATCRHVWHGLRCAVGTCACEGPWAGGGR